MLGAISPHRNFEKIFSGFNANGSSNTQKTSVPEPPVPEPPVPEPVPAMSTQDSFVPPEPEDYSVVSANPITVSTTTTTSYTSVVDPVSDDYSGIPAEIPMETSGSNTNSEYSTVDSVEETGPVVQQYQPTDAPPQTLAILDSGEGQNFFTIC